MTLRKNLAFLLLVGLAAPGVLLARENIVLNGSMESGQGPNALDPHVPASWTLFGTNVERSSSFNLVPPGGGFALKSFGDATTTSAGAYEEIANVSPGQSVTASVQVFSPSNDKLGGTGSAGLVIEFLNMFGGVIAPSFSIYPLTSASPGDTWLPATLGPLTAPAGTAKVRITCRLQWVVGSVSGAAYWDGAQLSINSGPNVVLNGDFETEGHSTGQSSVGIDEWVGFNDQQKSSDFAKDGLASVKLGTREAYSGLYQDTIGLAAGDHLFMQAFVWNSASNPLTGNSRAGLKLEFQPNGVVPPPEQLLTFDTNATADTWTQVQLVTTVPPLATIARVVCIYNTDQNTTGSVYFDSSWAELSSSPGVNQLQNPSFESGLGGPNGIDNWTEFGSGNGTTRLSCFSVPAHDGDCTAKATGQFTTGVYQEIPATTGDTITIYAYLYTPTGDKLTGTGAAGVKVEWVLGSVPAGVDIGPSNNTILAATAPTNTWIPLTIDYTMPAGTNAVARFTNLIEKGSALTGAAYFDACEAVVLNRFNGCDVDADNDESLVDFYWFQSVFGYSPLKWNSIVFDSDDNGQINLADFNFFAPRMTGPHP